VCRLMRCVCDAVVWVFIACVWYLGSHAFRESVPCTVMGHSSSKICLPICLSVPIHPCVPFPLLFFRFVCLAVAAMCAQESGGFSAQRFTSWEGYTDYLPGQYVRHQSQCFKCLRAHSSLDSNSPASPVAVKPSLSLQSAAYVTAATAAASAASAAANFTWQRVNTPEEAAAAMVALNTKRVVDGHSPAPEIPKATRKRLLAELRCIQRKPHPSCDVYPTEDNLAFWKVRAVRVRASKMR
jgi:hypothetical protein